MTEEDQNEKARDAKAITDFLRSPVPTTEGNLIYMMMCSEFIKKWTGAELVKVIDGFLNGKKFPPTTPPLQWVKKPMSKTQYEKQSGQAGMYMPVGQATNGDIYVAFSTTGWKIPRNCLPLQPAERRMLKEYRERNNIYPIPA